MNRQELNDAVWAKMEDHLPGKASDSGRSGQNNRKFMEAILWLARTGAHWRALPEHFGKWNPVYVRFNRWYKDGVFDCLFKAMADLPDFEYVLVDSTIMRAHQHSAGAQKAGAEAQASGRSRRGISRKIHLATDAHGNPVRLILTGGHRNDITRIKPLLDGLKADYVLAPSH